MKPPDSRSGWRVLYHLLLWSVASVVLVQNLVLLRENRAFRALRAPDDAQVRVGTRLHRLAGVTLDGQARTILPPKGGSQLLLLTFSPGCPACQSNREVWGDLAKTVEERGGSVLWVSRDSVSYTREYCLRERVPPSNVIADPPYLTYIELGLKAVPNTIIVGGNGAVERVWPGPLDSPRRGEVLAYLGRGVGSGSRGYTRVPQAAVGCGPGSGGPAAENCK
jgi:peroxiredoxin